MYDNLIIEELIINITDRCNLNCAHCFKNGAGYDELTVLEIKHIIDDAMKYGIKEVDFSGGEILLYPQLGELFQLCKQYPSICFGFITNGLLLTNDILDEISEIEKAYVQISIDGASKETYERIRGECTYERCINAINLLKKHPIKDKRARTAINSVNYTEIEDIFILCTANNLVPSYLFTVEVGNAVKNWKWLNISDIKKLRVNNVIAQMKKKYNSSVALVSPGGGCDLSNGRERKTFVVGADGSVYFCDLLLDDPLGNITESDFKSIIQGESLRELYEREEERKRTIKDYCEKCKIFNECHYGCPGEARMDNNDYSQCTYKKMYFACYANHFF